MSLPPDLVNLAARQHGTFSRECAYTLGVTAQQLRRWSTQGECVPLSRHVFVLPGAPPTPRQGAMAGVLDAGPGSCLSLISSLALWDIPGFLCVPAHVLRPRSVAHRAVTLATVHSTTSVPEHHVAVLDGIPVTTPTRTCFDIAAHLPPHRVAQIVDRFWSRRLTDAPQLHAMRVELSRQGRNGLTVMDTVLDARPIGYTAPESGQESRFILLLARHGLRPMDRQVDIYEHTPDGGTVWIGRVDFLDRTARVIVEIDGDLYHRSLTDQAHDEARRERYRTLGYQVEVVAQHELWHAPDAVMARIRDARNGVSVPRSPQK